MKKQHTKSILLPFTQGHKMHNVEVHGRIIHKHVFVHMDALG